LKVPTVAPALESAGNLMESTRLPGGFTA
jgi:hypothetical protein